MVNINSVTAPGLKLRYFAYNGYEIKLPTGKTLVIDPCLPPEGQHMYCGYDASAWEACDYVFINHLHADHAASLGEIYNRFKPLVMIHAATAFDAANLYDIPYSRMVPFCTGETMDFDDFEIEFISGRHNAYRPGHAWARPSGKEDEDSGTMRMPPRMFGSELEKKCGEYGSLFNTNFFMTLPNNMTLGFAAGSPGLVDSKDRATWAKKRPQILFSQRASLDPSKRQGTLDWFEQMVDVMETTGCQIFLPIHMEDAEGGSKYQPADYIGKVNELAAERGVFGRMIYPERGQWYEISTNICKL